MTRLLTAALARLRGLLRGPDAARPPAPLAAGPPPFGSPRPPAPADLLAELRGAVWACAALNAGSCAALPPRLYVTTGPADPPPRRATRALAPGAARALAGRAGRPAAQRVEEVLDHPLLDLLARVNPVMNGFDLWELTTLYQEVVGVCYWLLDLDPALGTPAAVWPLPPHHVRPWRAADSPDLVDGYLYRGGGREVLFPPDRVIAFRYPDPHDPYRAGLSPLRACLDQARLASDLTAFRRARLDNHAVPDAIVSPTDAMGDDERERLERAWNAKMRRGGAGRVLFAESSLQVHLLAHTAGDLAALADLRATREDIANAFGVPVSYLTSHTNLSNLQAAEVQHARCALRPRLRRRDDKLNEQLVPRYDPTGRLFLASDDPVPADREQLRRDRDLYLRRGVLTPDEVRADLGLPPRPVTTPVTPHGDPP